MSIAITAGLLVAGAVYLFSKREMLRVILGFILLGHAGNLILLAAGGTSRRGAPFGTRDELTDIADPLPQAFVLTAIVIAFAITIFLLVLAVTGRHDDNTLIDDEPDDDQDGEPAIGSAGDRHQQDQSATSKQGRTTADLARFEFRCADSPRGRRSEHAGEGTVADQLPGRRPGHAGESKGSDPPRGHEVPEAIR